MNIYKYCYINTTPIADEQGNAKFDLPFPIYSQTIICDDVNHYCYLTNDLIGKECLVRIAYDSKDKKLVESYKGYLGEKWKDVVSKQDKWSLTKADALATSVMVADREVVTKYNGADKLEVVAPYVEQVG